MPKDTAEDRRTYLDLIRDLPAPRAREPFVVVGVSAAGHLVRQRERDRAARQAVSAAQEARALRGGQPKLGPIVRARQMGADDFWPGDSMSIAGLELGTRTTYAKGVTSSVDRKVCDRCAGVVRVKLDGELYAHKDAKKAPCAGQGIGEGAPVEVESVIVRGQGWAACWKAQDGVWKATEAWYSLVGKVTLARLRQLIASGDAQASDPGEGGTVTADVDLPAGT